MSKAEKNYYITNLELFEYVYLTPVQLINWEKLCSPIAGSRLWYNSWSFSFDPHN